MASVGFWRRPRVRYEMCAGVNTNEFNETGNFRNSNLCQINTSILVTPNTACAFCSATGLIAAFAFVHKVGAAEEVGGSNFGISIGSSGQIFCRTSLCALKNNFTFAINLTTGGPPVTLSCRSLTSMCSSSMDSNEGLAYSREPPEIANMFFRQPSLKVIGRVRHSFHILLGIGIPLIFQLGVNIVQRYAKGQYKMRFRPQQMLHAADHPHIYKCTKAIYKCMDQGGGDTPYCTVQAI